MSKCILYIRVSTTDQNLSVQNQTARLENYAKHHGYTDYKTIIDEGLSGRKQNRPGYQEVLKLVKTGQYDAVVVYSLSRFARSTISIIEAMEILKKYNVSFHSLTENIDTSTAIGRMFLTMLSALAQMEAEVLSERVTSCLAHLKKQGYRTGSVPRGKSLSKDGKTLINNPYELKTIKMAKELYSTNLSFGKIAKRLELAGRKNKKGEVKWYPNMIKRMVL